MTSFVHHPRTSAALARRGLSVEDFEALLDEILGQPSALSESETQILADADVPASAMTREANREASRRALLDEHALDTEVVIDALPTGEVAGLLGMAPASVRTSLARGALYGIQRPGRSTLFPRWQFTGSQVLPHLALVLAAIPRWTHPAVVARIMTTTDEHLDGRTPRDWLAAGGEPQPVVDLVGATAR